VRSAPASAGVFRVRACVGNWTFGFKGAGDVRDVGDNSSGDGDYVGPVNPEGIEPDYGEVADGVHVFGGLGNAVTVDLGDGILQIDTGPNADQVGKLLTGVAGLGGGSFRCRPARAAS
jgi:hypothetical protein